ncbi:transmembrane protein 65 isoform X10 [Drosophila albomicans]|uniref:Transmembrane protein 65 isoform X10 n=1 Tax=Drosophila albomicans TaxID=7291 RepID=A0A9C6WCX5_DROAB|nr:transmembrane protein 65 isoform X8 [Drosophila albomicans]XP_051858599.1 transmembrane protein 65 isoform X9 [Drosophila albomicans]XP_051858600.1 transmembrane protein 65 isoform X10 [Drosophila albomicans]
MRQQYCGALGHLMRHCQTQIRLTPMLANNSSCFPRRLTFRSSSNSNSYHYHNNNNNHSNVRHKAAAVSDGRSYSKFSSHLNSERAMELLCNLDEDERHNLRDAMFKMESDKVKKLYEMEAAEPPTAAQLYSIFFVNAVPFIAFGFLDNFIMIMAGEYIESYLGHFITLSTMAAAGLGNTISDIIGITTASYVESTCHLLGLKQPRMTPQQFELQSSRRASSWGRIIGITIGCLLGMCPLWFITPEKKECQKE